MDKVCLHDKFNLMTDYWSPRIVGELNGQYVKLAKCKGKMVWHSHAQEDELFLVVKGVFAIHLREQSVILNEGEFFVVPKGVEHLPEAMSDEAHVMLFEPKETEHTGDVQSELTVKVEDQVWI